MLESYFRQLTFTLESRADSNRNFSAKNDMCVLSVRPRSFLINCKSICHKYWCVVNCQLPYTKTNNCHLLAFSIVFLRKPFLSRQKQQTRQLQKLTNTALETLLNELFTLHPENNEQTINEYIEQQQINIT